MVRAHAILEFSREGKKKKHTQQEPEKKEISLDKGPEL